MERFPQCTSENKHNKNPFYELEVYTGTLYKESLPLSFVDLIVSDNFPVNDFDINSVALNTLNGEIRLESLSSTHSVEKMTKNVEKKITHMRPTYLHKILHSSERTRGLILNRIQTRYVNLGWKVMVNKNKEFSMSEFLD
jgi:hypothetical protein